MDVKSETKKINFDDRIKSLRDKEKTNEYSLCDKMVKDNSTENNTNKWKNGKKAADGYSKYNLAPLSSNEIYSGKLSNIIVSTKHKDVINNKNEINFDYNGGLNFHKKSGSMNDVEFYLRNNEYISPVNTKRISFHYHNKPVKSIHDKNYNKGLFDMSIIRKNDLGFSPKFNVNQLNINKINNLNESSKIVSSIAREKIANKNLLVNPEPGFRSNYINKPIIRRNSVENHNVTNSGSKFTKYNLVERSMVLSNNKSLTKIE
jgi:hypothetical protein